MKRIREEQRAGSSIIIREYDLPEVGKRVGEARKPKESPSPLSKVRANYRAAWRKLTALMNENCRDGDWHLTFTYKTETRPHDPLQARRDFQKKIIPEIRKLYAKAGVEFSYYFCKTEVGKRGGVHHHLVVPRIDPVLFRRAWPTDLGNVHYSPLYTGEYSALAAYFLKSDNPDDAVHYNPMPGRKWSMAKTTKRPPVPKKRELKGSWQKKEIYLPKGYILNADSYYIGENPYTHREYRCYIVFKPQTSGGGKI